MRHDVLHLGVHLVVLESPAGGFFHDGVGDGVRIVLFQARREPQAFRLIGAGKRHDVHHSGRSVGQRTGLVKHNRVRLRGRFQELTALDGDIAFAGLPDRREHRERHGQIQRAGEVDHEEGERLVEIPCEEPGEERAAKAIGNQAVGQMERLGFGVGLELLRLLDHADDLVVFAAAGGLGHFNDRVAFFHDSAGVDVSARRLGDRHRFAGHGGLVDGDIAFHDFAVQRNDVGGAHQNLVAGLDRSHVCQNIAAFTSQPYPIDLQRHGARQIIDRLAVGPFLQDLADPQKEHDRRRGAVVAAQDGSGDRAGVEDRHFKPASGEAVKSFCDKAEAITGNPYSAQETREEERAETVSQNGQHELFLVMAAECAPGVLGD